MSDETRAGVCLVRAEVQGDRTVIRVISKRTDVLQDQETRVFADAPSAVQAVSDFLNGLIADPDPKTP
jgi:hypothetical protein